MARLILTRGDSTAFTIRAKSQNLAAYTGKFTMRKDKDAAPAIQKTAVSGVFTTPNTDFQVTILKTDWPSAVDAGIYKYDFEITDGTNVLTIVIGEVDVQQDYS